MCLEANPSDYHQIIQYDKEKERKEQARDEIENEKIRDRKRANKYVREERERIHLAVHDEFGYDVKEEYLVKQGIKKVIPVACSKCKEIKAFPYQFLNKYDKISMTDTCSKCIEKKSEQVMKSLEKNMWTCACGITYPCCTEKAMLKHELSDRHKNALRRNRLINGKKYNTAELRILCRYNKIPY